MFVEPATGVAVTPGSIREQAVRGRRKRKRRMIIDLLGTIMIHHARD